MRTKVLQEKIKTLDKQDMLGKLKGFPAQCREAYALACPALAERKFSRIVFCGMGGSAIGGDIMSAVAFGHSKMPCAVNRDYTLPAYADAHTLVVAMSYSGNTEETLSALKSAREKGCGIVCISSNGKVEEQARTGGIPFVKIPGGYPPRCATGYLFFPCYRMMSGLGVVPRIEDGFFSKIEKWAEELFPGKTRNSAMEIAEKFREKVPVIYSDGRLLPATTRWKTQIAENGKAFAFINVLPEMNHNEIMSWRYPEWFIKKCVPVFITSGKEHQRTQLRFDIIRDIILKVRGDILEIKAEGQNLLEELFYLVILGDWVSFYLALLNDSNPTEINEINLLKKRLGGK